MIEKFRVDAVRVIYDQAVESGNEEKVQKIYETYPADFLDLAIAGVPDDLITNDENERGEQ